MSSNSKLAITLHVFLFTLCTALSLLESQIQPINDAERVANLTSFSTKKFGYDTDRNACQKCKTSLINTGIGLILSYLISFPDMLREELASES